MKPAIKHLVLTLSLALALVLPAGCAWQDGVSSAVGGEPLATSASPPSAGPKSTPAEAPTSARPTAADTDALLQSYYAAREGPVYGYFQNNSIQRFLAMWVEEATGITEPRWDLDSFCAFQVLDHDLQPATREDQELYYCTFTDEGGGRQGYAIFAYVADGPAIERFGVHETTPNRYDLGANLDEITVTLAQTDLDLSTATAARVSLLDTGNNRSDQVILFSDAAGRHYLGYLGGEEIEIEKMEL